MEAFLFVPVITNLVGRLIARQIRLKSNSTSHSMMNFKAVQEGAK